MKAEKGTETKIISPEAKREIQLAIEIDNLFDQLESGKLDEIAWKDAEAELRDKIKQYRQIVRREAIEEVENYYKRLRELKRAPSL